MSRQEKFLLFLNLALYGLLTVFSYSYVDLNLTISQNQLVIKFIGFMQQLGYYNRPQATAIYAIFVATSFSFFAYNLWLFYKNKVQVTYLAVSMVANTTILIFAYPFLSSDLFNYMFDAKILTFYHASPYSHKPLDFAGDEWLRFMRWTHRYSPYGPLWLVLSAIPSFLGFGKFILTLFAFKVFIATFHLANTYLIYKTVQKINLKLATFATASYALNPLLLTEGVANAHNDIVLATFLIATVFAIGQKNKMLALSSMVLGTAIKYIPIINLPWLVWKTVDKKSSLEKFIILNFITMAAFTIVYSTFKISVPFVSSSSTQVQFQPWYLFWTLPFLALGSKTIFAVPAILLSVGAAIRYLPYLYYGDWSHPTTINFMFWSIFTASICSFAYLCLKFFFRHE